MNDPHVVALHYEIDHGTEFDYSKAAPLDVGHDVFDVRVEDSCVRFSMNEHFATERDARSAVDDYIRGWELDAALQRGPNAFKLRFCRSEIEDRHPTPGVICVDAGPVRWNFAVSAAQITIAPGAYPKPPSARLRCFRHQVLVKRA